jgi:hypothetical protein
MLHVGEFFAMIILHVLAILGLIPAEFLTCNCFARESGTCAFLLKEYGLTVKDDKLIDILARKQYFQERYDSMARSIVENGKWKKSQSKRQPTIPQVRDRRQCKDWVQSPYKPPKGEKCNDSRMKARAAMKELLLSVNLAELKCIDVADVVGSSLQEQVRKLVHYAYEDDSWIDDNHTKLYCGAVSCFWIATPIRTKRRTHLKGKRKQISS